MIRPATMDDMPELMRMVEDFHHAAQLKKWATFEDSATGWANWFARCMGGDTSLCLLAEIDGKAHGFATALEAPAYWNPSIKTVCETTLWVDPKARGSGIGTTLVEAIAKWAKERGASVVAAGASVDLNSKAMGRMLMKAGFRPAEKIYSRKVA